MSLVKAKPQSMRIYGNADAKFCQRGCIALALLSLVAMTGNPAAARADDQKDIQGTWTCVETLKAGKSVRDYVGAQAVLDGNRLTWYFPQPDGTRKASFAKFRLDPSKNPKHFDYEYDAKPDKTNKRLYSLEGDTLKWSTNFGERPKTFAEGQWQFTMQRVPKP